ncbi:MAG: Shedu anti-phage system protein SduA domain-containing protein [Ilumatobacter sp.]|uniref:Shedu anti-phage system protein SduA domain-containing protein n=1 Tax=Ilumatobacter sp. TaxID=1967498 RepID=UPI00391B8DAA
MSSDSPTPNFRRGWPLNRGTDFLVGTDDFADLEIRPAGNGTSFYYFFHRGRGSLITDFILETKPQTLKLCSVKLIAKGNGRFSPRLDFAVRNKTNRAIEEADLPVTTGEVRLVKAHVDLSDCPDQLWALIRFLLELPELDIPDGEMLKVVSSSQASALDRLTPEVVAALGAGEINGDDANLIFDALLNQSDAVDAIVAAGGGAKLRTVVQATELGEIVEQLQSLVDDPSTSEGQLQHLLKEQWWIFGGRFVDLADRRSLTVRDQLDIPLIQVDGSLHVVELKTANVSDLVVKYRSHHAVGPGVNEAVGQAANYLRSLDEERATIKANLGFDVRRGQATVVIGHPTHCSVDREQVYDTLRTYNSHLARIQVITYEELLVGARNMAQLARRTDG